MESYIKSLCPNFIYKEEDEEEIRRELIDAAFDCLFYKKGNLEKSKQVLIDLAHAEYIKEQKTFVFNPKHTTTRYDTYDSLKHYGHCVIPVIHKDNLRVYQSNFMETLRQFPEYRRHHENPDYTPEGDKIVYVLGGFSALGNPGSFHNEFVRKLRVLCREKALPLFKQIIDKNPDTNIKNDIKLEILIDRMMYRPKGKTVTGESWHRDIIPNKLIAEDDEVYGGWVNLDSKSQYFSCIPGSHLGIRLKNFEKDGFETISKEYIKTIDKYKRKVEIPPGHMIIFPQYILHEVVGKKATYDMMRLFLGWRLTVADTNLHKNMSEWLDKQSVVKIPGGMIPPMYAANHISFFKNKPMMIDQASGLKLSTIEWSEKTMKQNTHVTINPKSGDSYDLVKRHMNSLEDYGFQKYRKYTKKEKNTLYIPSKI